MIDISNELQFQTSRSGGKGGQNVNKVETKVEVRWHVPSSQLLITEQKERILLKLANLINKDGYLIIHCADTRSQLENKLLAIKRINETVHKALLVAKKRKTTKIPKAAIEKRLASKRIDSLRKANRRGGPFD